jgi:hypothetical protein
LIIPAKELRVRATFIDFLCGPFFGASAYDASTFLGSGAPLIALQIDNDRHLINLPRKSYQQWSVGPVLSAKWKF